MYFGYAQYRQKGSAYLLLLIATLLILGSGVYFFLQGKFPQTPQYNNYNSYDNYNIYSNSALGFQFEYKEKDLKVLEDSEEEFNKRGNGNFRKNFKGYITYEPGKLLGAVVVLDKTGSYETNPFTVWVFENPDDLNIDNWYKNYWYYPFVWGDFTSKGKIELAPKTESTISGSLAKSGVIDYQPGKPKFVYLSKNKKMYLFRIIGDKGDKILASFKLNASSSSDIDGTANWKTYYSSYMGLELKYPPDWKIKEDLQYPQQFELYPPESDPELPSINLSISLADIPFDLKPKHDEYMSPFKPIVVGGITGIYSEYIPPKEEEFRLPLVGGQCQEPYEINLPVKNKTLIIYSCKSLQPRFEKILDHLILK